MAYLRSNGCEVTIAELPPGKADADLPYDILLGCLQGAAGWIVGHARVTRELLTALPELQIISRRGVGFERVDVDAVQALLDEGFGDHAARHALTEADHEIVRPGG